MINKLQLDLSGGMNTQVMPLVLKDNEAELVVNYNLVRTGGIQKRNGYTIVGSQMNDNVTLQIDHAANGSGIAVTIDDGGTTATIWRWTGSAWTAWYNSSYVWDNGRPPHFERLLNRNYVVSAANDMLTTTSNTLNSWGNTSTPGSADDPQATLIRIFQDRVYIANAATLTSRLWWSSLPDPSTGVVTWDISGDYADIDPDNQNPITALEQNGNRLLIFKRNAVYRWTFQSTDADRVIGVGAKSQELVRTNYDLGITFFVGDHGVYSYSPFSEGRPRIISRPIQRWFDQVSIGGWSDASMEVDAENVYICPNTASITVDGRTVLRPMFVYNVPLDAWVLYSFPNITIRAMGQFPISTTTSAPDVIYIGDSLGRVYLPFIVASGTAPTTDNGSPIATQFISKEYLLNFPEQVQLKQLNMFAITQGTTQTSYNVDRGEKFEGVGQMTGRITTRRLKDEKCNTIRVGFEDNSSAPALIEGFNIQYENLPYEQEKVRNIRSVSA